MGDPIYYSGLGDLVVAEVMEQEIRLLLADRETCMNDPAVVFLGDASGQGSTTSKAGLIGLDGYDEMAGVAENASVGNTTLTDASNTVAVAKQAIQYSMSDLMRSVDATGAINPARFAISIVRSADMRLQSMLAAETDGFTATAGTSGVNCSVDDWHDAKVTLILAGVPGPYLWMAHYRQYADWTNNLRGETGAAQYLAATAEQMMLRGPGYQGSYLGVPIFTSSKVPTANGGADRAGAMWGRGAVGYKVSSIPPDPSMHAIFAGPIMVEFSRSSSAHQSVVGGEFLVGTIMIEDDRGVSLITDA